MKLFQSSYLLSQDSVSSHFTPSSCLFHDISEMWFLSQALYPFVFSSYYILYFNLRERREEFRIGTCGWVSSGKHWPTRSLSAGLVYILTYRKNSNNLTLYCIMWWFCESQRVEGLANESLNFYFEKVLKYLMETNGIPKWTFQNEIVKKAPLEAKWVNVCWYLMVCTEQHILSDWLD